MVTQRRENGRRDATDLAASAANRRGLAVERGSRVGTADDRHGNGSYFRPERDGAALVGGHFTVDDQSVDPDGYDEDMEIEWAAEAVQRAADCAAYFGPETRIKRGWAGLYAVTPDNHPIIEETLPGLVTAAGFSGHGFQHAPATAQIVPT